MYTRMIRATPRLVFVAYLAIYLSLLVPAHAVLFSCHETASTTVSFEHSITASSPDHREAHDPSRCQICLQGGYVYSLVVQAAGSSPEPVGSLVLPGRDNCHERPVAHRIASRAPPLG